MEITVNVQTENNQRDVTVRVAPSFKSDDDFSLVFSTGMFMDLPLAEMVLGSPEPQPLTSHKVTIQDASHDGQSAMRVTIVDKDARKVHVMVPNAELYAALADLPESDQMATWANALSPEQFAN